MRRRVVAKKQAAPNWLVGEAIDFLKREHPSVLEVVANLFHATKYKTIEEWLGAEAHIWGVKLMTLITHMNYQWDYVLLQESWLGIVSRALKDEGLVEQDGRKLDNELRRKV
jgi:hypothetical protein